MQNIQLKNNIIQTEGQEFPSAVGIWVGHSSDNDMYWNTNGEIKSTAFSRKSFTDWHKSGHDANSIIANPKFKNAKKFDFTFKNKRNAKRIKFKPFDY